MAGKCKRGEGSVHLRKDGRWEGRYVIGYDDRGYPKTKNVMAKTKTACLEKLKQLREQYARPKVDDATPNMTFGGWLEFWYENHAKPRLRPTTQQRYEELISQHAVPMLGNIPLAKLSQSELRKFYSELKESGRKRDVERYGTGLSDRTVRNCHALCRTALEQAMTEGLIPKNPAVGCKLPPNHPKEMRVLNAEEMQRLLIQAKEDGYYELFLLELATGLRRGELLALQWEDLNFRTGELRIQRQVYRAKGQLMVSQTKTRTSNRVIILPPSILGVLKEYRGMIQSRWIFPSPVKEDSPLDPASVRKRLHTTLVRAECDPVRFHDLRHTFATTALEHGMDIKTLSTIIGHVSTATTLNVYAHVTDDMRRSAAAKIDMGIGKAEPRPENETAPKKHTRTNFQAKKGKYRKPGTGCVSQINDHLWEGRYSPKWPDGKKHPRNIYAHSEEECERLLAEMIVQVKAEISAERELLEQDW